MRPAGTLSSQSWDQRSLAGASDNCAVVLGHALSKGQGGDSKLWLEHPPWARTGRIPPREQVDDSVQTFRAIDAQNVLVLGNDNNLWLEHAPFGNVPPGREHVDSSAAGFQALQ
jgi:hypothetical protein